MIGRVMLWLCGRPRLAWALFGVSLLANVAFVAGFIDARSRQGTEMPLLAEHRALGFARQLDLSPEQARRLSEMSRQASDERQRDMARQLDLDAEATARFMELGRSIRERMRGNAPEMRAARRAVSQAMLADPQDPAAVDRALAETERLRSDIGRAIARDVGAFARSLSPDQRRQLRDVAERRGFWVPR